MQEGDGKEVVGLARPFSGARQVRPGSAGCPRFCAPIPLVSAPFTPPPTPDSQPRGSRELPGAPPAAPLPRASQVAPLSCPEPRVPRWPTGSGRATRAPAAGSWIARGQKRRQWGEWKREKWVPPRCRGPTQTGSRDGGRTRALALAWLWLSRCGLCSGAAPNSSPKGPGNSPESGAQPRVWGGGAEGERVGRGAGRESGLPPAPLATLAPGREERTQRAAR